MDLAEGIRKLGFRKWYEGQLLRSHAQLVLALLASLGLMMAIEGIVTFRDTQSRLLDAAIFFVCAAIGLRAIRNYVRLLGQAESAAQQADCPHCGTYARFDLQESPSPQSLRVRCRKCGERWQIEL
jgi:predicted Zn finger-like uncharacterized protein